jgi:hypothetical protein
MRTKNSVPAGEGLRRLKNEVVYRSELDPGGSRIISSSKVTMVLAGITLFLVVAGMLGQIIKYGTEHERMLGFIPKFNLDLENNVPTYFAVLLLLMCSCLLALIASAKKRAGEISVVHWRVLAVLFFLLSVDEAASIHELLNVPLRDKLHMGPLFHFSWVAFGIPFVLVLVISYLKFVLYLPRRTKILFCIAALLFLTGAVGFELIGGHHSEVYGRENMSYAVLTSIEETLEMAGLVIFIHALTDYLARHVGVISFIFSEK